MVAEIEVARFFNPKVHYRIHKTQSWSTSEHTSKKKGSEGPWLWTAEPTESGGWPVAATFVKTLT
jgi:hypothetical protein